MDHRDIGPDVGTREKRFDFGEVVLRYEEHVTWAELRIFSQIALFLHFFHIENFGGVPAVGGFTEEQNLGVFRAVCKSTRDCDCLRQAGFAPQIVLSRPCDLPVGDEIGFCRTHCAAYS
jgi:hypothetical protein